MNEQTNEQTTQQQLSVAEIAAALGTENLVLRLVQLQRQVTELERTIAALRNTPQELSLADIQRMPAAKGPVQKAGVFGDEAQPAMRNGR